MNRWKVAEQLFLATCDDRGSHITILLSKSVIAGSRDHQFSTLPTFFLLLLALVVGHQMGVPPPPPPIGQSIPPIGHTKKSSLRTLFYNKYFHPHARLEELARQDTNNDNYNSTGYSLKRQFFSSRRSGKMVLFP